jgi:ABC-type glutathione transport system ATPase component
LPGNAVSGPSLAVERILSEVSEKAYECETRLAFGASSYECILPTIRSALLQALTPNLNQMAVVGLVSIPGMMTGQLLGGASPLTAALYQMAILWLICGTAALSTWTSLYLASKGAIFDKSHRLTPHRIIKKSKKVEGIDKILFNMVTSFFAILKSFFDQIIRKVLYHTVGNNNTNTPEKMTEYELVRNENSEDIETTVTSTVKETGVSPPIGTPDRSQGERHTLYKVSYQFKTYDVLSNEEPFFEVNTLNVISDDQLLFSNDGISFQLRRGERICVEGPSGIGKTRLLRAIAKLDDLQSGTMSFLKSFGSSIPNWRSRLMYIPQALPPMEGSPKDLVREACGYSSRLKQEGTVLLLKNFDEYCRNAANSVGLVAEKMDQLWRDLSGGERQRALIAVALLLVKAATETLVDEEPLHSILLMDEPTAACDKESALLVESAIIESKATVLMITHDDRQSKRFAHKSLILTPTVQSPFTSPIRKSYIKELHI